MAKKFPIFTEIAAVTKGVQKIRQFVAALRPLRTAAAKITKAWRGAFAAGRAFGGELRNVAAAAVVAVGAVFGFATGSSQAAAAIVDAADKLGVPVERFQELRAVAADAGVGANNLETGLQRLNRRIVDAAGGKNKEVAELFAKMGISIRDANGEIRTSASLLPELADGFKANKNAALRTKIAFALFDSEGVDLVRVLSQGSEGLAQMSRKARELGRVTSEEALRGAAEFNDQSTSLLGTLRSLSIELTAALAPALGQAVTALQAFLADPERRKAVITSIVEAVTGLAKGVASVASAVAAAMPRITGIVDALGGWKVIGGAVAALFAGKLLVSAVSFGAALVGVFKAIGAAALANPVLAVIALIAAGAALIISNWDSIKDFFVGLWDSIRGAFDKGFVQGVVKILANFNPVAIITRKLAGLGRGLLNALGLDGTLFGDLALAGGGGPVGDSSTAGLAPLTGGPARGEMLVRFENAPPGTRVERTREDGLDLETDVGFGVLATGF